MIIFENDTSNLTVIPPSKELIVTPYLGFKYIFNCPWTVMVDLNKYLYSIIYIYARLN